MRKIFDYKPAHNYLDISSMEELMIAKAKLQGEIREKERDICDDFDELVYMLSPGRILAAISSKFDFVNSMAAGLRRGYMFIRDIMKGGSESASGQKSGSESRPEPEPEPKSEAEQWRKPETKAETED